MSEARSNSGNLCRETESTDFQSIYAKMSAPSQSQDFRTIGRWLRLVSQALEPFLTSADQAARPSLCGGPLKTQWMSLTRRGRSDKCMCHLAGGRTQRRCRGKGALVVGGRAGDLCDRRSLLRLVFGESPPRSSLLWQQRWKLRRRGELFGCDVWAMGIMFADKDTGWGNHPPRATRTLHGNSHGKLPGPAMKCHTNPKATNADWANWTKGQTEEWNDWTTGWNIRSGRYMAKSGAPAGKSGLNVSLEVEDTGNHRDFPLGYEDNDRRISDLLNLDVASIFVRSAINGAGWFAQQCSKRGFA